MANYFANPFKERSMGVDAFKGIDLANSMVAVNKGRSIDCLNIISDLAGKPVKRTGYSTIITMPGRINGIHRLKTAEVDHVLVHAGTVLYKWDMSENTTTSLYTGLGDNRSISTQYNGKLVIMDGTKAICYGEFDESYQAKALTDVAYVPTRIINADTDKEVCGGSEFEDLNFLTGKRYINYVVDPTSSATSFKLYLPDKGLTADSWLVVEKRDVDSDDEWIAITPTATDRTNGVITISKSSVADVPEIVDNVRVGYSVERKAGDDAEIVNQCTVAKLFGVGGNTNRLFISGNPQQPNKVYYSELDNLLYYPDRNYLTVGADSSDVLGFSRVSDYLAVHKEDNGQDASIFLISGNLDSSSKAVFAVKAGINTNGAVSKYAFAELNGEPLYMTANGVYAITTQEITFEKYAENRSYYINPKLTKAALGEAVAVEYNNYYYLSLNDGQVWVADGRQRVYEQNQPMSSFQYEWYYLNNMPARIWWKFEDRLYFGTADGKIKLIKQEGEADAYKDDEAAVKAYWCTPYFYFNSMTKYKSLKALSMMLAPYLRTSVDIYYRARGADIKVVSDKDGDVFTFNDIDFRRLTFRTDNSPVIIPTDRWLKRFMLIQFKFENDKAEGFGIYGFEAVYMYTANLK